VFSLFSHFYRSTEKILHRELTEDFWFNSGVEWFWVLDVESSEGAVEDGDRLVDFRFGDH
jgi:hypothetical protein